MNKSKNHGEVEVGVEGALVAGATNSEASEPERSGYDGSESADGGDIYAQLDKFEETLNIELQGLEELGIGSTAPLNDTHSGDGSDGFDYGGDGPNKDTSQSPINEPPTPSTSVNEQSATENNDKNGRKNTRRRGHRTKKRQGTRRKQSKHIAIEKDAEEPPLSQNDDVEEQTAGEHHSKNEHKSPRKRSNQKKKKPNSARKEPQHQLVEAHNDAEEQSALEKGDMGNRNQLKSGASQKDDVEEESIASETNKKNDYESPKKRSNQKKKKPNSARKEPHHQLVEAHNDAEVQSAFENWDKDNKNQSKSDAIQKNAGSEEQTTVSENDIKNYHMLLRRRRDQKQKHIDKAGNEPKESMGVSHNDAIEQSSLENPGQSNGNQYVATQNNDAEEDTASENNNKKNDQSPKKRTKQKKKTPISARKDPQQLTQDDAGDQCPVDNHGKNNHKSPRKRYDQKKKSPGTPRNEQKQSMDTWYLDHILCLETRNDGEQYAIENNGKNDQGTPRRRYAQKNKTPGTQSKGHTPSADTPQTPEKKEASNRAPGDESGRNSQRRHFEEHRVREENKNEDTKSASNDENGEQTGNRERRQNKNEESESVNDDQNRVQAGKSLSRQVNSRPMPGEGRGRGSRRRARRRRQNTREEKSTSNINEKDQSTNEANSVATQNASVITNDNEVGDDIIMSRNEGGIPEGPVRRARGRQTTQTQQKAKNNDESTTRSESKEHISP